MSPLSYLLYLKKDLLHVVLVQKHTEQSLNADPTALPMCPGHDICAKPRPESTRSRPCAALCKVGLFYRTNTQLLFPASQTRLLFPFFFFFFTFHMGYSACVKTKLHGQCTYKRSQRAVACVDHGFWINKWARGQNGELRGRSSSCTTGHNQ